MRIPSISDLIKVLDKYENGYSKFEAFLKSCDESLLIYWRRVRSWKDKYTDSKDDRELIFEELNSDKEEDIEYNADKMRRIRLELRKKLQLFIVNQEVETTASGQRTKAEIYQKGDLINQVTAANQTALKLAAEDKELRRHYIEYLVYSDKYELTQSEEALNKAEEALNKIQLLSSLRLTLVKLNSTRFQRKELSPELKEQIETLLPSVPQEKIPLIEVQLTAMEYFLNSPSLKSYKEFKKIYFKHFKNLKSNRDSLFVYLINALALVPNKDEKTKDDYIFLYQFGIKNNLLSLGGRIPTELFENIIFVAAARGDRELIQLAIKELLPKILLDKERRRCLLLANSYLLFLDRKFDDAIKELATLGRVNDFPYHLVYRRHALKVQCLFESTPMDEILEALKNEQYNFRAMLNKYGQKGTKQLKNVEEDRFLNLYKLLCMIPEGCSMEEINNFIDSCNGQILESKWAMKQVLKYQKSETT